MIKELVICGQIMIAEIQEGDGNVVIVKNPLVPQILPDITGKGSSPTMVLVPLSPLNPLAELKVPQQHVYAVLDVNPEVISGYKEIIDALKLQQSGLEVPPKNDKGGGSIIPFN